jgi:hypothetical protein
VQVLNSELVRAALAEGSEGKFLLEHAEITADYIKGRQSIRIALSFKGSELWVRELPMTATQVELSSVMSDKSFEEKITTTMRSHLNLVAQMHYARLEPMFPNSIQEVTMDYDIETNTKLVRVKFKNGHVADGPEHEAKSEFFLAKCTMLYDLPPI